MFGFKEFIDPVLAMQNKLGIRKKDSYATNPIITNAELITSTGEKLKIDEPTTFKVLEVNDKWVKIQIGNEREPSKDLNDMMPKDGTGVASKYAGKTFYIDKSQYKKIFNFPGRAEGGLGGFV